MRWVAEKEFDGEAADLSAADGVKEGGVGRGAESTRDVGSEGGVFKIGDGRDGGVDGEGSNRWGTGGGNVWGIRGDGEVGVGCGVATHLCWLV